MRWLITILASENGDGKSTGILREESCPSFKMVGLSQQHTTLY